MIFSIRIALMEKIIEIRKEAGVEDRLAWLRSSKKLIDSHEFFTDGGRMLFGAGQKANREETEIRIKKLEALGGA